MKEILLYCFPFAGGMACYYNRFKSLLNEKIKIIPIELMGRGTKSAIPSKTTLREIVDSLYYDVINQLDEHPYMFFGHSLGGLIEYELYYELSQNGIRLPNHIFFSGCRAPHLIKYREKNYQKNDHELLQQIRDNGGTPAQFFENETLINMFLPILRADYQAIDTYNFIPGREKIKCNITVLKGNSDLDGGCDGSDWHTYCEGDFQECIFEGGHFFINHFINDIAHLINKWGLVLSK